ncbi:hypothetical protein FH972_025856 [Carpinus fangiana]|uniref:Uncharacterized protein n=1 Tax=Carpinus fangiana TaxID=176857 RepID=A0A5N6L282_9ROSI|nr:hypothetical protein FH972_025856 [Carpinus fangiana]
MARADAVRRRTKRGIVRVHLRAVEREARVGSGRPGSRERRVAGIVPFDEGKWCCVDANRRPEELPLCGHARCRRRHWIFCEVKFDREACVTGGATFVLWVSKRIKIEKIITKVKPAICKDSAIMSTSRLRKAFRYPDEGSTENDPVEGIDEQEQEDIIQRIEQEDATSSMLYKNIFLGICGITLLLHITAPLFISSLVSSSLVWILCFLSSAISLVVVFEIPVVTSKDQRDQIGLAGLEAVFSTKDPNDWRHVTLVLFRNFLRDFNGCSTRDPTGGLTESVKVAI